MTLQAAADAARGLFEVGEGLGVERSSTTPTITSVAMSAAAGSSSATVLRITPSARSFPPAAGRPPG